MCGYEVEGNLKGKFRLYSSCFLYRNKRFSFFEPKICKNYHTISCIFSTCDLNHFVSKLNIKTKKLLLTYSGFTLFPNALYICVTCNISLYWILNIACSLRRRKENSLENMV